MREAEETDKYYRGEKVSRVCVCVCDVLKKIADAKKRKKEKVILGECHVELGERS